MIQIMRKINGVTFTAIIAVCFSTMSSMSFAETTSVTNDVISPKDVITQSLDGVKKDVEENAEELKTNGALVNDILDKNVMPYINAKTVAKRVMGRYFRTANKEQRYAFLEKFKTSLVEAYATGLGNIGNISYTVEEMSNNGKKAQVLMKAKLSSGSDVPVIFAFKFNEKENKWMGENLEVAGINLGLAYRDKFAEDMQKYKNDIDAVIANWNSDITE